MGNNLTPKLDNFTNRIISNPRITKMLKKTFSHGSKPCKCGRTISATKIECLCCSVRTTRPDLNVRK